MTVLLRGAQGVRHDIFHDLLELGINLVEGPAQTIRVLAHLQAGNRHATGIGGLCGAVQQFRALIHGDGLRRAGHIRAFAHDRAAVVHQRAGGFAVDLVLCGARQRDIARNRPHATAVVMIFGSGHAFGVFLDTATMTELDILDDIKLDALGIVHVSARIRAGDHLRAQTLRLLNRENRDIAGTGNNHGLALEGIVAQHTQRLLRVVAQAVAGRLGAGERTAEFQALAGEHAGVFVTDTLVLAEQIADFTGTDIDVAGGNIGELADMTLQLGHERLAEAHHLTVGTALRIEIGAAFTAAHWQAGQGVLENLLETEELDDGLVDRRVEAQAALVRADRRIELDAVAAVHLDVALVIRPCDAELHQAFRLNEPFQHAVALILGMLGDNRLQTLEHLMHGLQKFRLVAVTTFHLRIHTLDILVSEHSSPLIGRVIDKTVVL